MKLYFKIEAPYEWVRCENDEVESFGEVASLADLPINENVHDIVAVVPGELVTVHRANIPAKSKKQFIAAAPYALEEDLVDNVDDLHFVPVNWALNQDVPVAVVAKVKMQQWQALIKQYALAVTELVPEFSLIPVHDAAKSTIVQTEEGSLLVNTEDCSGMILDSEFLSGWLEQLSNKNYGIAINDEELVRNIITDNAEHDVRFWQIGNKMAHWLEHKPSHQINLLVGDFQTDYHRFDRKQYKLAGYLLMTSLLAGLLFNVYEVVSLRLENKAISSRMVAIVQETFPSITSVIPGKERFQMQQQLLRTQGGQNGAGDFQTILAAIAQVLKRNNAVVDGMSYRLGELTVSCTLKDFAAVDKLTNSLNQSNQVSAKLKSSAANGDQITARYVIRRG